MNTTDNVAIQNYSDWIISKANWLTPVPKLPYILVLNFETLIHGMRQKDHLALHKILCAEETKWCTALQCKCSYMLVKFNE